MKVYLIEKPRGVLLTSGIGTKEAVQLLNLHRSDLPTVGNSLTTRTGYYVEAFDITYPDGNSFADDKEKMRDFSDMPMDAFLSFYQYLTSADYYATLEEIEVNEHV